MRRKTFGSYDTSKVLAQVIEIISRVNQSLVKVKFLFKHTKVKTFIISAYIAV